MSLFSSSKGKESARLNIMTIYVKVALSVNIQALKYRVSRKKRNTKYDFVMMQGLKDKKKDGTKEMWSGFCMMYICGVEYDQWA